MAVVVAGSCRRLRDPVPDALALWLGTIWGLHVMHGGEQSARRPRARTQPAPSLTRTDTYPYVLGVKGCGNCHDLGIRLGRWEPTWANLIITAINDEPHRLHFGRGHVTPPIAAVHAGQGVTWHVVSVLVSFIAVRDRASTCERWLDQRRNLRRPTVNGVARNLQARGRRFETCCAHQPQQLGPRLSLRRDVAVV